MLRTRLAALAVSAGVLASCTPPRTPAPRPSPTTPQPLPPIEERVDARGFRWRAGALSYEVSSQAAIDVRGDTLPADTLRVSALLTFHIDATGEEDAPLPVAGTVDAYEVHGVRLGAAPADTLTLPISFAGVLGPAGLALEGDTAVAADSGRLAHPDSAVVAVADSAAADSGGLAATRPCSASVSAPVALARDLLLLPPSRLAVGTTWSDSTVTTICRGEVPVTTRALRRFTVLGSARVEGGEATAIERTSEITVEGSTQLRGRAVTVSGTGSGRTTFYASVERGAILGADGSYETDLTIESGSRRQQFTQTVVQRVRLRGMD
jgi:hypothetical protein